MLPASGLAACFTEVSLHNQPEQSVAWVEATPPVWATVVTRVRYACMSHVLFLNEIKAAKGLPSTERRLELERWFSFLFSRPCLLRVPTSPSDPAPCHFPAARARPGWDHRAAAPGPSSPQRDSSSLCSISIGVNIAAFQTPLPVVISPQFCLLDQPCSWFLFYVGGSGMR